MGCCTGYRYIFRSHEIRWMDRHVLKLKIVLPLGIALLPEISQDPLPLTVAIKEHAVKKKMGGEMAVFSGNRWGNNISCVEPKMITNGTSQLKSNLYLVLKDFSSNLHLFLFPTSGDHPLDLCHQIPGMHYHH